MRTSAVVDSAQVLHRAFRILVLKNEQHFHVDFFLFAVNLVKWNFECSKTWKNERVLRDIKLQRSILPGGVKWENRFFDSQVEPIYSGQIGLGRAA